MSHIKNIYVKPYANTNFNRPKEEYYVLWKYFVVENISSRELRADFKDRDQNSTHC
jgi:hypothetical protein